MKIRDFIGVPVWDGNKKYVITDINGAYITVREFEKNQYGTYSHYSYDSGTAPYDNAVARGQLKFENQEMQKEFIKLYEEYSKSEAGLFDIYEEYFHRFS